MTPSAGCRVARQSRFRAGSGQGINNPVRQIDDGALVGHERRQGANFILGHQLAIANASFERFCVLAMLGPPAVKDLLVISRFDGELNGVDGIARLDLLEEPLRQIECGSGFVELPGHYVAQVEIFFFSHSTTPSHISHQKRETTA